MGKVINKISWQFILMLPMQACEVCGVPISNTCNTRTMIRAHMLPCASCCAVCDVLAIASSVRHPLRCFEFSAQEQLLYVELQRDLFEHKQTVP